MLGKVFKYEFKAEFKLFAPICLVVTAITFLEVIMHLVNSQIPEKIAIFGLTSVLAYMSTGIMVFVGFALVGVASLLSTYLFYKSVAGNEGYLTHTLPVTKMKLVVGKNLAAFVANILVTLYVAVLLIISVSIAHRETATVVWREISTGLKTAFSWDKIPVLAIIAAILMIIAFLVAFYSRISIFYACVSIGQINNNHKIIMSVVVYIIYTVITQTISSILSVVMSLAVPALDSKMDSLNNIIEANPETFMIGVALTVIVLNVLFAWLFNYISARMLKNHLNLE
ncbi:MAG: hypothetical protein K6G11_01415 [Lachnospiraceae bacterium]|nr:hypothetical protein [Lachnospiraceae bacterium]